MAGPLGNERGVVLAITLMIMGIMAVTGAAIITTSTTDVKVAGNVTRSMQALDTAEAGMSNAINHLRTSPAWGPDADNDGTITQAEAQQWAAQTQGTMDMGTVSGSYSVAVYDATGTYGRGNNSARTDKYTTLGANDVLVEATGTVNGVKRKVGLIVRNDITTFDYATYSNGTIEGEGVGSNPGKFTGKIYGANSINLQGNFDLGAAQAQSTGMITPDCNSGKFQSCNSNSSSVAPPVLDFAYYQNQANFTDQQVFMMTPTVGSTSSCGANCTQWPINYAITTMGTSYTVQATVQATCTTCNGNEHDQHGTYNHTVYWCSDPNWNGVVGSCTGTAGSYSFTADELKNEHALMNANQFNSYTNPTGAGYTSSVVNIIDAQDELSFFGPADPAATVDVTASILVGTAANNSQPAGELEVVGGAGTLNFKPANSLALVAKEVKVEAKYSSVNMNVGTATNGAVVIATHEMEVEASDHGTGSATFNMNGSLLVGNDATEPGELDVGGDGNTSANFTYTPVNNLPQGWQNYGTMTIERREWRELS